ncbi:hypothetical protein Rin_00013460, partial [Candidatus Regiella insecticola 5.15]
MSTTPFSLTMTQTGDTRLSNTMADAPLQLTYIVLGDNTTPIADFKQATQVRNEVYRAPLDRVSVDRTKNLVVCEWIVPEAKKNTQVHEIGVFEFDTLVAIGYSSSPLSIGQERGPVTQKVHIQIDNPIFLSAIEEVTNLTNIEKADTHYLNASENLKDIHDKAQARLNLGLGPAATKNVDTDDNGLMTRSAADTRYFKGLESLFSIKEQVSKLTQFFDLFVDDLDVLTYILHPGLTSDQLEAWLASDSNEQKFTRLFASYVTIKMIAIVDSSTAMRAIADSSTAMRAIVDSLTA